MRKTIMFLTILVLSLPAYGEVLVYQSTVRGDRFDLNDSCPRKDRYVARDFMVIDVNLTDWQNLSCGESLEADDATRVLYGRDGGSKWYCEVTITTLTIYKMAQNRVAIVIETDCSNCILIGSARYKNLGVDGIDKVPVTLKGNYLINARFLGNLQTRQRLDLRRTRNAAKGGLDIVDTVVDIVLYLRQKGYIDIGDCCDPT